MRAKLETRYLIFNLVVGLCAINCAFAIAYYFSFIDAFTGRGAANESSYRNLLTIANLLYVVISLRPANENKREFRNYSLFLIGYMTLIVFLKAYELSRVFHLYFLGILLIFTTIWRYSNLVERLRGYLLPSSFVRKVLLIGETFDPSIFDYIDSRPGNYRCVGILSESGMPQLPVAGRGLSYGEIDEIEQVLRDSPIDEVLVSTSALAPETLDMIVRVTEKYHTTTCIMPPYFEFLAKQNCQSVSWMGVPVISVAHSNLSVEYYQMAKRALDVCFSLVFLAAVFPILFFVIAPAIWLSGKGPIFFKQLRKGYKQEPFLCYKFRTMKSCSPAEEIVQAKEHDPRLTVVGKTLRKTSLDEVPQFLNVLLGHMSIVGPRPHMVEHDQMYEKFIDRYNVRFVTKPGITGWAQINGFRGATEEGYLMEKRIEHDLWYIKNWSIGLDIKIMFLTFWSVLKGDKNAY